MKIILTSTVNKVGKIGDIVEVKSGYAKNFLIPKPFATIKITTKFSKQKKKFLKS